MPAAVLDLPAGDSSDADAGTGAGSSARIVTWYVRIVSTAVLVFVAVGLVGLVAAVGGVARPSVVFPLGLVAGAGLVALWRPDRLAWTSRAVPPGVVVAGVLVIAASTAWNVQHASQHVLTDRDQGIYVNGGKWLAERGTLLVDGRGPGLDGVTGVEPTALGQSVPIGGDDSALEIQSPHLLHTYLAEATWVGGNRGLFVAPVLIGGLALAVFFLFALRVVPGPLAVAAVAGLAANFVWLYAARDALSEPLVLLATFGGAWMLAVATADGHRGRSLVAGIVLGTGLAARIDAGVGIALVVAVAGLLAARRARARRRAEQAGAPAPPGAAGATLMGLVLVGLAVPAVVAAVDARLRNTTYLRGQEAALPPLVVLLAVGVAAGVAVVAGEAWAGRRRVGAGRRRMAAARPPLAVAAAVAVVAVAAFAWFAWPEIDLARAERPDAGRRSMEVIQEREGDPADGERTYAEGALRRLAWYAGGPAVALGVVGMALLVRRSIAGRARPVELLLLAVVGPALVIFVARPTIYPDQPWMMRRYLPQVFPGLLVCGAVAGEALRRAWVRRRAPGRARRASVAVTAMAVLVLVGGPLPTSVPLRHARAQAGHRAGIERLCAVLGPDATVVVGNGALVGPTMVPALRSFCGVPVVRALDGPEDAVLPLAELVSAARAEGRTLWVVAHGGPKVLAAMAPTVTHARYVELWRSPMLVLSISAPPSRFVPKDFGVWAGRVDTA